MPYDIPKIGRVETVDLREVWASEPYSFTPWLAEPENLQFLADSLDLPGLELVRTEHPVDSFSADIVAKIVDSDHYVLIENQLERTDHLHLGQVLTYAPRFDARIIVWVARQFTDAHRAALDWLNRITSEGYAFFGIEVRAVRIGSSIPAPLFDIVVKPNDWSKITTTAQSTGGLGEATASNLQYWPGLHQTLVEMGGPVRRVTSELKDFTYWAPIANSGRAYVWAYRSQSRKPYVVAGISLYNAGASTVWSALRNDAANYERSFGEPLKWQSNKVGTAFHIQTERRDSSLDQDDWPAQQQWLAERMVRFEELFSTSIKHLIDVFDVEQAAAQAPPT
jgi:hypothetical protein